VERNSINIVRQILKNLLIKGKYIEVSHAVRYNPGQVNMGEFLRAN
jgi:hypothetical protein